MKHLVLGSIFAFSLLASSQSSQAAVSDWNYSKFMPSNGDVFQYDLDGDGQKESIALLTNIQAKNSKTAPYQLIVNNIALDEVWPLSDSYEGKAQVKGFKIGDLNVKDRSKEIAVFGPDGDSFVCRIYAWRDGKIRRVLRTPIFIERFNGDGSVTELKSSGWSSVRLPYRLNRQGELKLVKQPYYPLEVYRSSGEGVKPTRILKDVSFYLKPNSKSQKFIVKKGSSIMFDRADNKGWVGAKINGRIGWVTEADVNADADTFQLFRAG